jgi:hypothetical protein
MAVTVGERVTGRDLRFLRPMYSRLAGDITTSANDVLTDIPGLAFLVRPHARYYMDGYIAYTTSTTADLKVGAVGPEDSDSSIWGRFGVAIGASGSSGDLDAFRSADLDSFGSIGGGGVSTAMFCMPHGTIITKDLGGTVQLRFCQVTSDASATTIKAGSWLRLQQSPT